MSTLPLERALWRAMGCDCDGFRLTRFPDRHKQEVPGLVSGAVLAIVVAKPLLWRKPLFLYGTEGKK